MLYLRTGLPGASKTLNTLKEIVENSDYDDSVIYYHNIKLLFLDLDVCHSFEGFFYGSYLPNLEQTRRNKYQKNIQRIHTQGDLASLEHFPYLNSRFYAYANSDEPMQLFLTWVKKLYPKSRTAALDEYHQLHDEPLTLEQLRAFKLDWRHFDDPTKWQELENGSVIVIDECQDFFPPMSPSAERPPHYSEFAKHRHKGVDIHLVTQNEKFLDHKVRTLAHRHIHYYNKFGASRLTRLEASMCFNSTSTADLNQVPSESIKRDSNYYGVYWSADIHTHKLRIPKKLVIWGSVAVLALLGTLYTGYQVLYGDSLGARSSEQVSKQREVTPGGVPGVAAQAHEALTTYTPRSVQAAIAHPLAAECIKIDYAGHERVYQSGFNVVKHYFNCSTGSQISVDRSVFDSDGNENQKSELVEESYLLDLVTLRELGYSVDIDRNFIRLNHASGLNLLFRRF